VGTVRHDRLRHEGVCPIRAQVPPFRRQAASGDGGGKSGGFRTIVVFRAGDHSFLVHGFTKSDKANVSAKELKALRQLANVLLGFSDEELRTAQGARELTEVVIDDEEQEG